MKKFVSLLFLLGSLITSAQQLTGIVKDSSHIPIPNVYILNSTQGSHTHTNERGFFKCNRVQLGDTLTFIHMGYEEKK